jgi:hypothetical protein
MGVIAAKRGLAASLVDNLVTSFHLTLASIRLVGQHKIVLLLPACTLAAVAMLVVAPLTLLVWSLQYHPEPTTDFFETLYFVTVAAARAGNWGLAISAAIAESYLLWSLWMIPVLTAVLYFSTAGMHIATQQIKRQQPDLRAAFRLANGNFRRLVALAAFNATVYTWMRYLVFVGLGIVPFVGTWIMRGLQLVLNAVSYVILPIVVYERAGARQAFRSAWHQIKATWSGLLVGSGLVFFAMFFLFEVFAWGLAQQALGAPTTGILSLVAAAVLYAFSTAASAALRAVLYWYATTGEVPPGFPTERLPQVGERTSFTGAAIEPA